MRVVRRGMIGSGSTGQGLRSDSRSLCERRGISTLSMMGRAMAVTKDPWKRGGGGRRGLVSGLSNVVGTEAFLLSFSHAARTGLHFSLGGEATEKNRVQPGSLRLLFFFFLIQY